MWFSNRQGDPNPGSKYEGSGGKAMCETQDTAVLTGLQFSTEEINKLTIHNNKSNKEYQTDQLDKY